MSNKRKRDWGYKNKKDYPRLQIAFKDEISFFNDNILSTKVLFVNRRRSRRGADMSVKIKIPF